MVALTVLAWFGSLQVYPFSTWLNSVGLRYSRRTCHHLPALHQVLLAGNLEPLSQYVVKCSFIPVRPTSALELHISMCQRATQDLTLQRGREYTFDQKPRATQFNLLSSEEIAGLR